MKTISFFYLILAIFSEVIATSSLKNLQGFRNLIPSIIVISGYIISFYFMSLSMHTIPMSVAYAIWSGAGTVLITIIGIVFYRQSINFPIILGMGCIICGSILLDLGLHH